MSNIISFNRNSNNGEEKKLITSIQKYCFIYGIKKDLTGFSEFYLILKNLLSAKTDEYQNILTIYIRYCLNVCAIEHNLFNATVLKNNLYVLVHYVQKAGVEISEEEILSSFHNETKKR